MNKLGFGFLHLPTREDGEIDLEKLNQMVDTYDISMLIFRV